MVSGGLAINKSEGVTSAQVGNIAKAMFGCSKAGHIGTLDPNATGVLILMLGNATKVIPYVQDLPKTYIARFRLGFTSNTYDIWGELKEHGYGGDISKDHIRSVMEEFTGKIDQTPPMFSAKKIDGVRLYNLAYQGIELPRKPNPVEIFRLELLSYDQSAGEGEFLLECSKGTYVRSLISDIGMSCGCGAVMSALKRTSDMGFSIDDCIDLNDIHAASCKESLLIPMERFISHIPGVELTETQANKLKFGNNATFQGYPAPAGLVRCFFGGSLLAIAKLVLSTGEIVPERLI
jgi:tRNA pseudouridine55 synthase